jgi:hypothetical protein
MFVKKFRTLYLNNGFWDFQDAVYQFNEQPFLLGSGDTLSLVCTSSDRDQVAKRHWRLEFNDPDLLSIPIKDVGHIDAVEMPGGHLAVTFFESSQQVSEVFWHYVDRFSEAMTTADVFPPLPTATDTTPGVKTLAKNGLLIDTAPSNTYHEYPEIELFYNGDLKTFHTLLVQFDDEFGQAEAQIEADIERGKRGLRLHRSYRIQFVYDQKAPYPRLEKYPNIEAADWGIGCKGMTNTHHPMGAIEAFALTDNRLRVTFSAFGESYWIEILPFVSAIIAEMMRQSPETKDLPLFETQIFIDDIDTFSKVREIRPQEVKSLVPLTLLEDDIKSYFQEIIGENFSQSHWPGETNDLFTSHLKVGGKRLGTAFMLKGRGTKGKKGKLRIRDCGTNGDQIVKLVDAPANLYVIQHVDEIDERVIKDLKGKIKLKNYEGESCQMCIIDGTDTARILRAYSKINS